MLIILFCDFYYISTQDAEVGRTKPTFTKKQPEIWFIASDFSCFSRVPPSQGPQNPRPQQSPTNSPEPQDAIVAAMKVLVVGDSWSEKNVISRHPGWLASWHAGLDYQSITNNSNPSNLPQVLQRFFWTNQKNPLLKRKWLRGAGAFCSTSTVPSGSSCCKCTWTNWKGAQNPEIEALCLGRLQK